MFLTRLIQSLDEHGVDYALVGGFAVALHGAVRGTLDIDLIIRLTESDYVRAETALNSIGLQCPLPVEAAEVFRFRKEFISKRNMLAWSFSNPDHPSEIVDIMITVDLRKREVVSKSYGRLKIKVLGLRDLIRMKQGTGRAQDEADVQALRELQRSKKGKK